MFERAFGIVIAFLAMLAVSETASALGEGNRYVLDSVDVLRNVQTIECDIRIGTFVDGKEHSARGRYEEQALPGATGQFMRSIYRLDINFFSMNSTTPGNHEPNRMTLVCYSLENGRQRRAEHYTHIEGVKSFRIIDLIELEKRLKDMGRDKVFTQVSEVRHLGGLSGKMQQIGWFYEFSSPSQENLHDEETIPVWKLTGQLQSVYHKKLLAQFGGLKQGGRYPVGFPSDIEIWIGCLNSFPYKIRYLRRISEKSKQKELLFQESFHKVALDGTPIPVSKFAPLTPPEGFFPVEDTENFIKLLGL